jgi:Protein of unknown function (DUF3775)
MPAIDEDVPVELNISLEKLRDILVKAREFDLEDFPDEPEPGEDPVSLEDRETLLDAGDDPTEIELRELIEDLNDDEVVDLIAITWIGRGDFDPGDLAGARALARERHNKRTANYLMGMPTLPDYITEGAAALGWPIENLE